LTKPGLLLFRGKGSAREKIEGDFFNLIGLLLFRLGKIMERFGIPVFEGRFS
jgi:septum formation protein